MTNFFLGKIMGGEQRLFPLQKSCYTRYTELALNNYTEDDVGARYIRSQCEKGESNKETDMRKIIIT